MSVEQWEVEAEYSGPKTSLVSRLFDRLDDYYNALMFKTAPPGTYVHTSKEGGVLESTSFFRGTITFKTSTGLNIVSPARFVADIQDTPSAP